jgi:predicted DNA-binding protein YlxM (UPF0122 family)
MRKSGEKFSLARARQLYLDEKWPVTRIAEYFDVSRQAVYERFRRHNVVLRERSIERRKQFDKDILIELYVRQGLSIRKICEQLGASAKVLAREMDRHGIKRRTAEGRPRKFPRLDSLAIGNGFVIERLTSKHPGSNFYRQARELGIRVVIRRIGTNQFKLTRTPLLTNAEVRRMFESGLSVREIAEQFMAGRHTIARHLSGLRPRRREFKGK